MGSFQSCNRENRRAHFFKVFVAFAAEGFVAFAAEGLADAVSQKIFQRGAGLGDGRAGCYSVMCDL